MSLYKIIFWLSLAMIFLMPIEGILAIPGFGTASRLIGVVTAGLWLCFVMLRGTLRRPTFFHALMLLFFLWNAASLFWSHDPDRTITRIITYAQMALLIVLIWDLYATNPAIRNGLQAFVLGLYLAVLGTYYNFFSGYQSTYGRYSSIGENSNDTGVVLALGIPLAWYLATSAGDEAPWWQKLVNYCFIPAAMFAIALTATRFALLMTIPAFLFGLISLRRFSITTRLAVLLLVVGGGAALWTLLPESSIQRLATVDEELADGDFNGRLQFWQRGLEVWSEHPLVGIGAGAFDQAMTPFFGRPRSAHNSFVAMLTELGLVGLVLLSWIVAQALILAWRQPLWEARFWLTLLIVWLAANSVLTWVHNKPTWLLLVLLSASAYLPYRREQRLDHHERW